MPSMTQPEQQIVTATVEDREAWIALDDLDGAQAERCRSGALDNIVGIQILASHAENARREELERCAGALSEKVEGFRAAAAAQGKRPGALVAGLEAAINVIRTTPNKEQSDGK